ncbi:MAG: type II toxin-antitoxin system RelE/ParE family toxin [Hyphomonadaceae bacterium]|nr:type II toxin-antitoxin system RelE/ParE family toxin [Hyphomonadaceae bacterium]
MTRSIAFTPAARQEAIEAFDWYALRASNMGVAFQDEIDRQVARVLESPHQFPAVAKDIFRARLRRFPYSLFFKIAGEKIVVIACFHASRNPRHWKRRT